MNEGPRWQAGCHLEIVLIKDLLEKSSVKINSQKNPSHFVLTQVSRECERGTSLAGWLSVGDARKVDWSHERHVEADRAIGVMH